MICSRCQERVKDWKGSDPRCGFPEGVFDTSNWNCATLNALRDEAEKDYKYSEDEYAAILPIDGDFIVLGWYKSRGRTQVAIVISDQETIPLTLELAERYLESI